MLQRSFPVIVLLVSACGARQGPDSESAVTAAGQQTDTATLQATVTEVDASLEPESACEAWATMLIENVETVPMVADQAVSFIGRFVYSDEGLVPQEILAATGELGFHFDIDVAERTDDGVRCSGLVMAYNTPGATEGELAPLEDLESDQWQAVYLLDLDLVVQGDVMVAEQVRVAIMQESVRAGDWTSVRDVAFGDPELEEDLDGDGDTESVFFAYAQEETSCPLTQEFLDDYFGPAEDTGMYVDEGDRLEYTVETEILVILDEVGRILMWETFNMNFMDNLDYFEPPPDGWWDIADLGLGRTAFVWMDPWETFEPTCTLDGEEDHAYVDIDERPSYLLFDGEGWQTIFEWIPKYEDGRPCDEYPVEVAFDVVDPGEGPHEISVDLSYDTDETSWTESEIWKYDGEKYVLDHVDDAE